MRTLFLVLLISFFAGYLAAQSTIEANDIIRQINAGADIDLTGTTIRGDLDFTRISDREQTQTARRGGQDQYRYAVRSRLTFTDCTFEGDVWGFRIEGKSDWGGKSGPAHMADFHKDVMFRNCTFEEDVNFKYSRFLRDADFPNAVFEEDARFKYTKFNDDADFRNLSVEGEASFKYTEFDGTVDMSRGKFRGLADFKYTEFDEHVTFASAVFEDDAVFKYTEFPDGVDLADARFRDQADFKYAKFRSPANFAGTDFGRRTDFKYTKLDGRKFNGN